ncbi:hypothetical protein BJX64DRAFT_79274 [Aspergillus heterothallicus]
MISSTFDTTFPSCFLYGFLLLSFFTIYPILLFCLLGRMDLTRLDADLIGLAAVARLGMVIYAGLF